nr:MAG TPA: hypothetical protein [Caudoviricetes sp.]
MAVSFSRKRPFLFNSNYPFKISQAALRSMTVSPALPFLSCFLLFCACQSDDCIHTAIQIAFLSLCKAVPDRIHFFHLLPSLFYFFFCKDFFYHCVSPHFCFLFIIALDSFNQIVERLCLTILFDSLILYVQGIASTRVHTERRKIVLCIVFPKMKKMS